MSSALCRTCTAFAWSPVNLCSRARGSPPPHLVFAVPRRKRPLEICGQPLARKLPLTLKEQELRGFVSGVNFGEIAPRLAEVSHLAAGDHQPIMHDQRDVIVARRRVRRYTPERSMCSAWFCELTREPVLSLTRVP